MREVGRERREKESDVTGGRRDRGDVCETLKKTEVQRRYVCVAGAVANNSAHGWASR